MNKKYAWLNWSSNDEKWILRLWIDEEWQFSKSWSVRNVNEDTGLGFISESILCEIKRLYELGYSIKF